MSKRPELTAAERALPYAKFYDLPITPIPPGCLVFFPHILYNSVQIMNRW